MTQDTNNCTRHAFTDGQCTEIPGGCRNCPGKAPVPWEWEYQAHAVNHRRMFQVALLTIVIVFGSWLMILADELFRS